MTEPTPYAGRPLTPAPGVEAPELLVARFRPHARRLFWCALVLIVVAAAVGYFYGNMPAGLENWTLLTAAGAVVFLLVVLPLAVWRAHVYIITTRRVIERRGLFRRRRRELAHVRGYSVKVRRGAIPRMFKAGTLVLDNGIDPPMRLANVPTVDLVHEALVDQVEVSQILAHREAQQLPPAAH